MVDRSTLRHALQTLQDVPGLGTVFAQLGYAGDDAPSEGGWHRVARWNGYEVVATQHDAPQETVRDAARKHAASARLALFVALKAQDHIALAAPRLGVGGSSKVLTVPLVDPSPSALDRLADLAPNGADNALMHALRIEDRLAREDAGERFFTAFRRTFARMEDAIPNKGSSSDRSLAALLPLTRVLFLYFVQAKGWLDGRPDYLRTQLDCALSGRRGFHRTILHPLFFGTLNRPANARRANTMLGRIPYLNGGLFEPHPVERRLGPVLFDNTVWRDAFDGLFERFTFCVREADEVDAIAPDMLGRVFEGVMDAGERRSSGTFYTPESVVNEIVRRTVETALTGSGGVDTDLAQRIARGAPIPARARAVARRALRRLRVLDPAVGSGAFLLGALEILSMARRATGTSATPLATRRAVLQENLFGVDQNPIAVRLAELRLWLALVADDPTSAIEHVGPLPNLDGIVRQGDSLLDPIGAARALGLHASAAESTHELEHARRIVFESRGSDRRPATERLRACELRLATAVVSAAHARTSTALRELAAMARSRDLFGQRAGLTEPQQRRRAALKRDLRRLRTVAAALENGTVPFFSFEVHRPDVMERGGFDVVVGNPPWVRAERLPAQTRSYLKSRFDWWQRGPGRDGFAHLPDLSVAFLQRAMELTAPGGAVGFLLPSKVATAGYGTRMRHALVQETEITYLHRVPDREVARFGATTYPLALIAKRGKPAPDHTVTLGFAGKRRLRQERLEPGAPWILIPDRERRALDHYRNSGTPLGALARPALGMKTGADRTLVGEALQSDRGITVIRFGETTVEVETEVLRGILRGRDVAPFAAATERMVIWGYDADGTLRMRLPPLAARYVARHKNVLKKRTDYRRGPLWTLFRLHAVRSAHPVVWSDIARRPGAVALEASMAADGIPLNSCYVAGARSSRDALIMVAAMNSTWAAALVRAVADEARGNYRRINASVAAQIPIPSGVGPSARVAALSRAAHRGESVDPRDIDRAVATALGLPHDVQTALASLADAART